MNQALRPTLLILALVAMVACDRKTPPPSEAKATHEEAGVHAKESAHVPLKDIRGLSFLVVPAPKGGGRGIPPKP